MSEKAKNLLYAVVGIGAIIWLITQIPEILNSFSGSGDFVNDQLPNLIFIICILFIAAYCLYSCFPYWLQALKDRFNK